MVMSVLRRHPMIRRLVRFAFLSPLGALVIGFACIAGVSGAVAASFHSSQGAPVVEPGSISCTGVTGAVKYKPRLVDNAKGWSVSVVKGSLSGCTTSGGTKVSGSITSGQFEPGKPRITPDTFILTPLPPDTIIIQPIPNPDPCPTFPCGPTIAPLPKGTSGANPTQNCEADNADGIDIRMKIAWTGGTTKIAPSIVVFGGALPAWGSAGTIEFNLPVNGAQVTGSYAGTDGGASSVMGLQTATTLNQFDAACSTKKGFSGFAFTGSMTLQ